MLNRVSIVAGRSAAFGSGHWSRMEVLAAILRARGIEVELLPADSEGEAARIFHQLEQSDRSVRVLDARDADPSSPDRAGGVLLDNRCKSRQALDPSYLFFDTIPHPDAGLSLVLENALMDPALLALPRADARSRGAITAYLPPHSASARIDELLLELSSSFSCPRLVRIGGSVPTVTGVDFMERLGRDAFFQLLVESRIVVSYFGMTILESWQAGSLPVLVSIGSAVHDRLSLDLSNRTSIPFLTGQRVDRWVHAVSDALKRVEKSGGIQSRNGELKKPGSHGYDRLILAIQKSAGSSLHLGRVP